MAKPIVLRLLTDFYETLSLTNIKWIKTLNNRMNIPAPRLSKSTTYLDFHCQVPNKIQTSPWNPSTVNNIPCVCMKHNCNSKYLHGFTICNVHMHCVHTLLTPIHIPLDTYKTFWDFLNENYLQGLHHKTTFFFYGIWSFVKVQPNKRLAYFYMMH